MSRRDVPFEAELADDAIAETLVDRTGQRRTLEHFACVRIKLRATADLHDQPLDPALRQQLEAALQQGEEIFVYLFVRLSMEERQLALYRAKLLGTQGPGPHADTKHTLPRVRGCGTWLKLADLRPAATDQIRRLYDAQTDQPVPVWTDLSTDFHLIIEGELWAAQPEEPCYSYWLLCLSQARAKAEFDRNWRFRPIATYQPGSVEFITEHEADTPQRVLVYDRIFGGPTYLAILGVYEVTELVPQGAPASQHIQGATEIWCSGRRSDTSG